MSRKRCHHDESNVEVLNVTSAPPGWGFAILYERANDYAELSIRSIVAWAAVRCRDCDDTLVVPATPVLDRLSFEMPTEPSEHYEAKILEPGQRAVARRCARTGRLSLLAARGPWEPGYQPIEGEEEPCSMPTK